MTGWMINMKKKFKTAVELIEEDTSKYKVVCSCGTKTVMVNADRTICRGCGHWLYRNKQIEFKYKMKDLISKGNKKNG